MLKTIQAGLLAAAFAASAAGATTIDFEGRPSGPIAGNEYASLGVLFDSVGGSGAQLYDYGAPFSETISSDDWYKPLLISFVNPLNSSQNWTVNSVSIFNGLSEDEWHVTAYDINGHVLATQTLSYAVGTVSFSGVGAIHSVLLDAHETAFAADNLTFSGLAPVPEPSTYAMLGWRARRK